MSNATESGYFDDGYMQEVLDELFVTKGLPRISVMPRDGRINELQVMVGVARISFVLAEHEDRRHIQQREIFRRYVPNNGEYVLRRMVTDFGNLDQVESLQEAYFLLFHLRHNDSFREGIELLDRLATYE